jgi:hypothetical protein
MRADSKQKWNKRSNVECWYAMRGVFGRQTGRRLERADDG